VEVTSNAAAIPQASQPPGRARVGEIDFARDLPEYVVLGEIGRGVRTVVYRVLRHGVKYALKIVKQSASGDSKQMSAFRREAALLACVDHPRIPRIQEVGQVHDCPYLVMDLVEGQRLSDRLAGGHLAESVVIAIAIDVVGALTAAHRAGLVHRDVKPDNIMVDPAGRAWLVDFGMAGIQSTGLGDQLVGTLVYSSPEQSGVLKRPVDGRSDLYSLGAALFECLTGSPPFTHTDIGDLLRAHATQPPPDPRSLRPELSEPISLIIQRMLAKDPDDRYQRGDELLADLSGLVGHGSSAVPHALPDDQTGTTDVSVAFVGRENELDQLSVRWRHVLAGRGGSVIVRGAGGIGKTRLVSEFCATVQASGHTVLRGRCASDDPAPLTPLRQAISAHIRWAQHQAEPRRSASLDRIRDAATPFASLLTTVLPTLSSVVGIPPRTDEDRPDQVATAVAAFLTRLAVLKPGLVLYLDDGHRSDQATLGVLQRLAQDLSTTPLLVVVTTRDDPASGAGLGAVRGALSSHTDRVPVEDAPPGSGLAFTELALERFGPDETERLLRAYLPGADIDPNRLVARGAGNPFTLLEYLRLIVEMGLIRPSWGTWLLDLDELDRLELPGDTLNLVRRRVKELNERTRAILGTAAVIGDRFTADLVAEVHGLPEEETAAALQEAVERHLIEARRHGGYGFLHDRIIEALLAEVAPAVRRKRHQRVAEALDRRERDDPGAVYATAHHYLRGETAVTPDRLLAACAAAGNAAMAANAPADALVFLEPARDIAARAAIPTSGTFQILLGEAQHQCGHFEEAKESLLTALRVEHDPVLRAKAYSRLARVHIGLFQLDTAIERCQSGLAELGQPLPAGRLTLAVTTAVRFVAATVLGWTGIGFGSATGQLRVRNLIHVNLYESIAQASALSLRRRPTAIATMRTLIMVHWLGPSVEYARAYASLGYCSRLYGLNRLANMMCAQANRVASSVTDPRQAAIAAHLDSLSVFLCGIDNGQRLGRCVRTHGRWLETSLYRDAVKALCRFEAARGNTETATMWYQHGRARLGDSSEVGWDAAAIALDAVLGRPTEVTRRLAALPLLPVEQGLARRLEAVLVRLHAAVEQGDLSESFDHWVSEFFALKIDMREVTQRYRLIYAHQAFGRLEQCRARMDIPEAARLAAAKRAVEALGASVNSTLLRALHRVAVASLHQVRGDPTGALRWLARAEPLLRLAEAPIADYEAARVKARALAALGHDVAAYHQVLFARALAFRNGWNHRMRWIAAEFGVDDSALVGFQSASYGRLGDGSPASRRLAALEQVSLAAFRVLDPDELARVALDETIKILAADRALLFLVRGDTLVPSFGRDSDGNDIRDFSGFSASLVARVHETGKALVVTGTEEGVALGAASMALHGLRSIMIAPLRLEGRPLGAVYLDSRVAKGIFTSDDAGLLVAIVNHIAVSLETARAARLEADVLAARQQEAVAERLQTAMTIISESLDPDEVLIRLVTQLMVILPGDQGWLLRRDGDQLTVVESGRPTSDPARAPRVDLDPATLALMSATTPIVGVRHQQPPPAIARLVDAAQPWLALPLATHSGPLGVAIIASSSAAEYQEQQAKMGVVLVRHSMTAYENASHLVQTQILASTDSLTGIANRAHFFELAARLVTRARAQNASLAAAMIDIDYFKAVNDRYGHQVGDEVIRGVTDRIMGVVRDTDVLGRYGGEEFALVLPDPGHQGPAVAERMRTLIAETPIETQAGPVPVSISVGVTDLLPADTDVSSLLARADRALYRAKASGRNRTVALTSDRR
jgi:diguanylate cyclase (GGDEF)-like protein